MRDPEEHYAAAQQTAELHLEACWAALHGDDVDAPDTLAPFCGCLTCEVREVLYAAEPYLRLAWEKEETA